jgi:hypothetical protein
MAPHWRTKARRAGMGACGIGLVVMIFTPRYRQGAARRLRFDLQRCPFVRINALTRHGDRPLRQIRRAGALSPKLKHRVMEHIMRYTNILLATAAVLAGCATPYDDAERVQRDMDQIIALYGPACDKLGYAGNTDQWRNCVLQLSLKDAATNTVYAPRYHPAWPYRRYW